MPSDPDASMTSSAFSGSSYGSSIPVNPFSWPEVGNNSSHGEMVRKHAEYHDSGADG